MMCVAATEKTNKQLLTLRRFSFFGAGKCFVLNTHDEREAVASSSESTLAFADCFRLMR